MNPPALAPAAEPALTVQPAIPPLPETVRETGLSPEALDALLLKILYTRGTSTGQQLVGVICLPFTMVDERLLVLQQRRMIEVKGSRGAGRGGYVFELTGEGRDRAREALASSQYAGPAPVPLDQYRAWVRRQSIQNVHVKEDQLAAALAEMVLAPEMHEMLGPAVNSAKSLFLYGAPGNGKTLIAELISSLLGGAMYLPYAVDIEGQIMVVYDPVHHRVVPDAEESQSRAKDDPAWLRSAPEYDRRYARVARPVVITGGELTLEQLDLLYDHHTKMYQAPFQMKANGGVLIVDDFGRQRVPPRELLNRWIFPLEKRQDYLTLHTGTKFPVPFDCLLIFATNLDPRELVEEAFLRRIHYKLQVPSPTRPQYEEIFRRCCAARGIPHSPEAVDWIYAEYYEKRGVPPRACHPRDITDHVRDIARFIDTEPTLSIDLLNRACRSYFLDSSIRTEPGTLPSDA